MSTAERHDGDTVPNRRVRLFASGDYGHVRVARQAVESAAAQLAERSVPVSIEHDPTWPPIGRTLKPQLVELDDGELAVEAQVELYTSGTVLMELFPLPAFERALRELETIEPERGELLLDIDSRSFELGELEALRDTVAFAGEARTSANVARFSQLPDSVLMIALGPAVVAAYWFSKGFFTRLGERAADGVSQELGTAYEEFKKKLKGLLSRRNPPDRPPLTLMTFQIEREGGGLVDVEGSSRADGDEIEDFLDSGQELLSLARAYARLVSEPERLETLHFARVDGSWVLRYGLDLDARPLLPATVSLEDFEQLLERVRNSEVSIEGDGTVAPQDPSSPS